jgi:protein-tyrosine sulfotransferase
MRYNSKHERIQKILNPSLLRILGGFKAISRKIPLRRNGKLNDINFFLIGSGRSGTTLLRTLLNQYAQIVIPPESHGAIPNAVKKYYSGFAGEWQTLIRKSLHEFNRHKAFQMWNLDLTKTAKKLAATRSKDQSLNALINHIYEDYKIIHKPNARLIGDKTPFNTLRLKWIIRLYPDAKFIYVLRDPRAVCSSFISSGLNPHLKENILRWKESLAAYHIFQKSHPQQFKLFRYEDLVASPEVTMKNICSFLEIPFQEELLQERKGFSGDGHIKHHKNSQESINAKSLEKWRNQLSLDQIKTIETFLKSQMMQYHYLNV